MKKLLVILILVVIVGTGAMAQDFAALELAFGNFAEGLASALPFASTIGLNWSDSYIGKLLHMGAGVTIGVVNLPASGFKEVIDALNIPGFDAISDLQYGAAQLGLPFEVGIPFPVIAAEARLGGLFVPFDIGMKIGTIPPELEPLVADFMSGLGISIDYELFGMDVRIPLIEEKRPGLIPGLSIGAGFNYLRGGIQFTSDTGFDISGFEVPDPNNLDSGIPLSFDLSLAPPTIGFEWETTVFDLKAQLSKRLLYFFTPYVGVGATIGTSRAGGFVDSKLTITPDLADYDLTLEQVNNLLSQLPGDSPALPELTDTGFGVFSEVEGIATRVFGGMSLNLLIIRADVAVLYEIASQTFGASVNARIQF